MNVDWGTERDRLRHEAYADDKPLQARVDIYRFRTEPCVGLDLSEGMVTIAKEHAPALCGDAQALPFPDATFDVVLAPHMLYHVPDMALAASEVARVLRPAGVAAVVTNGGRHMREFADLTSAAVGHEAHRFTERFTLERGRDVLEPALHVEGMEEWRGSIAVTDVEPVVAYVDSTRSLWEAQLPDGITWDDLLEGVRRLVVEEIASTGSWRAQTHVGALICRHP